MNERNVKFHRAEDGSFYIDNYALTETGEPIGLPEYATKLANNPFT